MVRFGFITLALTVFVLAIFATKDGVAKLIFSPRPDNIPQEKSEVVTALNTKEPIEPEYDTIVTDLEIPWEVVFLPGGEMLVTERPGKILKISADKKIIKEIGVKHKGEGGLLGMAIHPDFNKNNFVFVYFSYQDGSVMKNKVVRYTLKDDRLLDDKIILDGIPGSSNHDGGRIKFGPDGYLYITTGDAEHPDSAQDKNSLSGKILRVKEDGGIPADNPFGNAIYSYGHRNPQGIVWDKEGNLWATEHGPSGVLTGNDEVNLIKKGGNYGWPEIKGKVAKEGMITPKVESGREETWAPSGIAYLDGSLYFAGLRGSAVYKVVINGDKLELSEKYKNTFGRVRTVVVGPDGYLYIATNNKDGRGSPISEDDRIIKIKPF